MNTSLFLQKYDCTCHYWELLCTSVEGSLCVIECVMSAGASEENLMEDFLYCLHACLLLCSTLT